MGQLQHVGDKSRLYLQRPLMSLAAIDGDEVTEKWSVWMTN